MRTGSSQPSLSGLVVWLEGSHSLEVGLSPEQVVREPRASSCELSLLSPSLAPAFAKYLLCVSGGGTVEQPRAWPCPQAPALQAVRCPAAHQNPARCGYY